MPKKKRSPSGMPTARMMVVVLGELGVVTLVGGVPMAMVEVVLDVLEVLEVLEVLARGMEVTVERAVPWISRVSEAILATLVSKDRATCLG